MNEDEFEKKLEELKVPEIQYLKHQEKIKEKIMSAERSAALSIWFFLIPAYLIFCAAMKIYFNVQLHLFDMLDDFYLQINNSLPGNFLAPFIMFGLPGAAIIINMLAVMEFKLDRAEHELKIRVKYKPINIMIVLLGILILGLFVIYWLTKFVQN